MGRIAIVCGVAILLSGCIAGSSSTSVSRTSNNPWDGESGGSAECRESVHLSGFVNATAGALSIVVEDGAGDEKLRVLFDRVSDVNREFTGAAGAWTVQAAGSGFVGSFKLTLAC